MVSQSASRFRAIAGVFAIIIAILVLNSCAKKRVLQPPSESYHVFVSVAVPGTIAIDVIDSEADSIVHRIPDAGSAGSHELSVSKDGRYLAALDVVDQIALFDTKTFQPVAFLPTQAEEIAFTSEPARLVCITDDSTLVYAYPTMALDTVWPFGLEHAVDSRRAGEMIGIVQSWDSVAGQTSDGLIRIAVSTGTVLDSFRFVSSVTRQGIIALDAAMSPDGRFVYLMAYDDMDRALFAYDLRTHANVFRTPLATLAWSLEVNPDGAEIWLTQSALSDPPPDLGYVLIVDAETGSPQDTIFTASERLDRPGAPLPIRDIVFHPMLSKAYVTSHLSRPSVIVVCSDQKHVIDRFYSDPIQIILDVAIAPY